MGFDGTWKQDGDREDFNNLHVGEGVLMIPYLRRDIKIHPWRSAVWLASMKYLHKNPFIQQVSMGDTNEENSTFYMLYRIIF